MCVLITKAARELHNMFFMLLYQQHQIFVLVLTCSELLYRGLLGLFLETIHLQMKTGTVASL